MYFCTNCNKDCSKEWYGMDGGAGTPIIFCPECYNTHKSKYPKSTYGGGRGGSSEKEKPMDDKNVGLRCPKCGITKIQIRALHWMNVHGAGDLREGYLGIRAETLYLSEIAGCDAAKCVACDHTGTVADFRQKSVSQMLLDACQAQSDKYSAEGARASWSEVMDQVESAIKATKERGLNG